MEGLLRDKTRKPGTPRTSEETVRELVDLAERPAPDGEMRWTVRALAKTVGIGASTAHGILAAHRLAPHRVRQFKVSTDPEFTRKTCDLTGLCMDPPDHAVVLSIDEKTRIQALGRTRKGLPMKPVRPATMTHEDKRNGTTTLFAVLLLSEYSPIALKQNSPVRGLRIRSGGMPPGTKAVQNPIRFFLPKEARVGC